MGREIELFESADTTLLRFCFRAWMKSSVYKRKVDTADELFARVVDAAACITKTS